ncbi:hypothetical protein H072_8852 [Dactylellina haptotyla CBS 200.50]|uniref:Ubiquitin carboxyl-terminal hydrolase n=1 Tax=Dactylellina haptotyla (strain CBS 200.50) TaxID=1284197 RepID=S8A394_DACHA|nr:hypothetical protein H072_8852 [Dactylellina haptotyla CBS 200.50]
MNHHHYPQMPPPGPYLAQPMISHPHNPPHPHHHHHPPHPHQHQQSSYQPTPQHMHAYSQHQHSPHPASQASEFRPLHFHQPNRPLIVSTPASYIPQYPPPVMGHPMSNSFYRPPQIHPGIPYYPSQEGLHPPPDIPSPASLAQEAMLFDQTSSPSQSAEAIEEPVKARYETPVTPSSSLPQSPVFISLFPLPNGSVFNPPKLPWYSAPEQPFPPRKTKALKKQGSSSENLVQTHRTPTHSQGQRDLPLNSIDLLDQSSNNKVPNSVKKTLRDGFGLGPQDKPETFDQPSPLPQPSNRDTALNRTSKPPPRSTAIPVVPFIPALHKLRKGADVVTIPTAEKPLAESETESSKYHPSTSDSIQSTDPSVAASTPPAPRSWADLVRSKSSKDSLSSNKPALIIPNNSQLVSSSLGDVHTQTLAEVLQNFTADQSAVAHQDSLAILIEPRGLINTGNMCFMNSILQALIFCGPFFLFLDLVGRNVAHNFKSETPLIDAMIIFMREFRRTQPSSDKSGSNTVVAGDPFVPEYVYEAVRGLKRFSSMRRGHQQDAEEFLNFFLDVLHEECVAAMKSDQTVKPEAKNDSINLDEDDSGWLEVGHKQRAAITRNVGHISGISPVTKIFGGQMRNELRVAGQRSSVMREPYQSLQLDIQSNEINNIVDAIRQLSIPEQLQGGDFKSARGASASATKQTFIDTLPPVLILHLKRFHYNNTGGTQKIWKGIGYPLELDIPSEALSPTRRSAPQNARYNLTSVVYHHGKSATNGHYTVDVKRQDGWLRIDDTVVKRISVYDVTADDSSQNRESRKRGVGEENGWKEVSFASKVAGKAPLVSTISNRDDKVAYLLFYELQ